MAGAIVLSNGVPGLMYAWRLSQAVIMATYFSHEIDASRLRFTAKVRFGNPTDNSFKVSYPVIKYFHNQKLLCTSSEVSQNFNLDKGDEIFLDPINSQILRQSHPDLFTEYEEKGTVNIIAEIKTLINEKTPFIRTVQVRI